MTAPELRADLAGLRVLAEALGTVADTVNDAKRIVDTVPAPGVDTYAWQVTVDAMARVLREWSAELGDLRELCDLTSRQTTRSADELAGTDALTGRELADLLEE